MSEAPKLKDYLTPEVITQIGERFRSVHQPFDVEGFSAAVLTGDWADLTFTNRTKRIAAALWDTLGLEVEPALAVVTDVLPDELGDPDGVLNDGFWMWPLGDLIAAYAVDHPDAALDAIEALTKRFTGEFAIRPFLARYPETLDRIDRWTEDPNEHVRRLASEGTRPRLPWASRLDLPLDRVLLVLSSLRRDESLYVRRSVANHLNDLAKDRSDQIVTLLEEWHAEDVPETTWIVRHAMRNHLKNGDPRVLALFGYQPAKVDVAGMTISPDTVAIGQSVTIGFEVVSTADKPQKLMIDLVVGYRKANGSIGPKVFKFKDFELDTAATETCSKKLGLVVRSTRKLYAGAHTVTVRVNGTDLATASFDLTD